jgi:hypothetical protein
VCATKAGEWKKMVGGGGSLLSRWRPEMGSPETGRGGEDEDDQGDEEDDEGSGVLAPGIT